MEKMNRRLSKYALDPDNKKMYRGRAEQWAEYTEKWQSYHENQLAKAEKSGIIYVNLRNTLVNDVHSVGKIDTEVFKCVSNSIITDEVIITDERIAHIKDSHPNDYEMYYQFLKECIEQPDYIIEANKPNSALILKSFEEDDKQFKMILRLVTAEDNPKYKNSIITFMKINKAEWSRLLRNKKILYKAE